MSHMWLKTININAYDALTNERSESKSLFEADECGNVKKIWAV